MSQSSQSTPLVTANIGGANHQVNLRDYLNMRVAPFLKKAITESLDASPEFPLQWLGENLIHQSMLYEGNPDSTNIKERFLYKFEAPVASHSAAPPTDDAPDAPDAPPRAEPSVSVPEPIPESAPIVNGSVSAEPASTMDTQMSNNINGSPHNSSDQQNDESRDTEMAGTS